MRKQWKALKWSHGCPSCAGKMEILTDKKGRGEDGEQVRCCACAREGRYRLVNGAEWIDWT